MKTDYTAFVPSAEQLAAVEKFKIRYNKEVCRKRGFRNWIEALQVAWHCGWDDQCEDGGLLRQIRNTAGGHEWLELQPKVGPCLR
jgi:hypothetical protein